VCGRKNRTVATAGRREGGAANCNKHAHTSKQGSQVEHPCVASPCEGLRVYPTYPACLSPGPSSMNYNYHAAAAASAAASAPVVGAAAANAASSTNRNNPQYPTSSSSIQPQSQSSSPSSLVVIGVALIVDHVGKGARMAFRYPCCASGSGNNSGAAAAASRGGATTTVTTANATAVVFGSSGHHQRHHHHHHERGNGGGGGQEGGGGGGTDVHGKKNRGADGGDDDDSSNNLFFTLTSRQMAKLFRPKPALCGQPMTLSVGGTIFCCCATLMPTQQQQEQPQQQQQHNLLALFSVVVALAPRLGVGVNATSFATGIPISGWIDANRGGGGKEDGGGDEDGNGNGGRRSPTMSSSFLAVQRVHVSLARLCRILEREERRCRYVSIQTDRFKSIRSDVRKHWHERLRNEKTTPPPSSGGGGNAKSGGGAVGAATGGGASSTTSSPVSMGGKSSSATLSATAAAAAGGPPSEQRKSIRKHRKTTSFSRDMMSDINSSMSMTAARGGAAGGSGSGTAPGGVGGGGQTKLEISAEALEEEAMEVMLATDTLANEFSPASPTVSPLDGTAAETATADETGAAPDDSPTSPTQLQLELMQHRGNLAQELAQTYHALARNDHDFPHPASDLLTGRGGIVYVNRHIAVAIEAVSPPRREGAEAGGGALARRSPFICPHHTLLFPLASPSQLLDSLKASGAAGPRRLQQFLLMVSPQKSLTETAADANLPLQSAVEIATYLVGQGACLVSPVLTRSTRLACHEISRVHDESLAFSQTFGPSVNLFLLVSFLTESGRTLGESMSAFASSTEKNAALLREQIGSTLEIHAPLLITDTQPPSPTSILYSDGATQQSEMRRRVTEETEDFLFKMVTWLRSRLVLNHLLEFLVFRESSGVVVRSGSNEGPGENEAAGSGSSGRDRSEKKMDSNNNKGFEAISDEMLFNELAQSGCLDGKTTLQCCAVRVAADAARIRGLAVRSHRIRIVSRAPAETDEW